MKITPEQLKDYLRQSIDSCQYEMDKFGGGSLMNGHIIHNHGAQWAYKHILEVIEKGFDNDSANEKEYKDSFMGAEC